MRLLLLPSPWSCGYFPMVTTYFASLLFNCRKVATHVQVESLLGRLGCCRSDKASNYSWRATINSASWLFIGSPLYLALVVRSWCSPGFYVATVLHDLCAWQTCMGPRSWCVAASDCSGRDVFSVVRDSRMWCPHGIGRDSWVWGEQGTLEMMNSPHEVGDEAFVERRPLSGGNGVALG